MLDTDLAVIYGLKTSRLKEQVKRNKDRFPDDFMFQLSDDEKADVIKNCEHLQNSHNRFSEPNKEIVTENLF